MTHVEQFLTYAQRDRNWSPATVLRYGAVLEQVTRDVGDPIEVDIRDIEGWWATRFHLSPASRASELAALRSFYRWATKWDHRPDDPTRRLERPKIDNHVPRPIGKADLDRLMGTLTEDSLDLRRAIALGAWSGMRVSEAAGLTWAMIDQESRRIYVRGKGSKERVFGLNPVLLDALLPEVEGNVVAAGGKPYSGATLQRKVNRLLERNGINHTYHDLRKRAATLVLARGISPIAVAQAFGWSSIQTAQAYAVVGDETLDEIANAVI